MASIQKKNCRKRNVQAESRTTKRQKTKMNMATPNDLMSILKAHQEKSTDVCEESSSTSVWMALHVVLDHTTFENSLLRHDLNNKQEQHIVPLVTRAYEESFMRECQLPQDKPCSLGEFCECNFVDKEQAFVGVAFVMPDLRSADNNMCILCLRKLTQMLFYRLVSTNYKTSQVVQIYGNLCGRPGEYHPSAMLVMPKHGPVHSMPLPVVAHQRSKYRVVVRDGSRHLQQLHVYHEDFH